MLILCDSQGTPEWHRARQAHITASQMAAVRAKSNTARREGYRLDLVMDLEGVPRFDELEPPPWFEAGKAYEDEARRWYQFQTDRDVDQTGFVEADRPYQFVGCSPDGIVRGEPGGIEIKYRKTLRILKQHISKPPPMAARAQMQAQMWVMGWEWVDYVNFWWWQEKGLEQGHILRVYRDDAMIADLQERACLFWLEVVRLHTARRDPWRFRGINDRTPRKKPTRLPRALYTCARRYWWAVMEGGQVHVRKYDRKPARKRAYQADTARLGADRVTRVFRAEDEAAAGRQAFWRLCDEPQARLRVKELIAAARARALEATGGTP